MFIFFNWAEFIIVKPIETMVYLSTKCQADLWPFIQGHSFGLPHTYLNIFFSEITGLFDGLFIRLLRSLDQNVYGKNKICSIISCRWPWPILTLLWRSGERLRTFRSSSFWFTFGFTFRKPTDNTALVHLRPLFPTYFENPTYLSSHLWFFKPSTQ